MTTPPTPFHTLRSHSSPLAVLSFNLTNTLLYAGDQDGHISITDLRTRRVISIWKAHEGGILGLEEWHGSLISQGRDNLIHVYEPRPAIRGATLSNGAGPSRPSPQIVRSVNTNSLNFCRLSICSIPSTKSGKGKEKEIEGLMAVPNLVDSELVDIYHLPSFKRIHASINYKPKASSGGADRAMSVKPDVGRTGLVMSLHIGFIPSTDNLRLVAGFEDGRVEVWACNEPVAWQRSWDGRLAHGPALWTNVWEAKGHNEAVMAMAVDSNLGRAFTVSADHLVAQYDLSPAIESQSDIITVVTPGSRHGIKTFSTGQIGNASIAISCDGNVIAVGGWDGKIRLFSASTLKPLGILGYHHDTVHALAFASSPSAAKHAGHEDEASTMDIGVDDEDEDEEEDEEEVFGVSGIPPPWRWLASGGKDRRVALWGLKDFAAGVGS